MSKEKIDVKVTRSPDFKIMYSSGLFGNLNPIEGRMTFYADRLIPKFAEDVPGQMKTDCIERELQVEVHMSPQQFVSVYYWMKNQIERMEKQGIFVHKDQKPKQSESKKASK